MQSQLTFRFIGNACGVFTGKEGTTILCDPWLVDGVFDGSWCHYPKVSTTFEDIKNVDAIYLSHLHPDHFDERYFDFDKSKPVIVLDHGPNFLIKKLNALGFKNTIRIKDGEVRRFKEFELTLFAPFAKHNFHEASVGNLIDSAMVISCDGIAALNANDNTPTVEACDMIRQRFGELSLAMMNYNAAGPYPSCFNNLTELEKVSEHRRILERNFNLLKNLLLVLRPRYVLPFAGAYVLGGDQHFKNKFLGTTTWDECGNWLSRQGILPTKLVLLREGSTFDVGQGTSDREYVPIDVGAMSRYIAYELSKIRYPYQLLAMPDENRLIADIEQASIAMRGRMAHFKIQSRFSVILSVYGKKYVIFPEFSYLEAVEEIENRLECKIDERLLRNIIDRKSHWNNAEIGAHIDFMRTPNIYEPDLHTGLQFFHL